MSPEGVVGVYLRLLLVCLQKEGGGGGGGILRATMLSGCLRKGGRGAYLGLQCCQDVSGKVGGGHTWGYNAVRMSPERGGGVDTWATTLLSGCLRRRGGILGLQCYCQDVSGGGGGVYLGYNATVRMSPEEEGGILGLQCYCQDVSGGGGVYLGYNATVRMSPEEGGYTWGYNATVRISPEGAGWGGGGTIHETTLLLSGCLGRGRGGVGWGGLYMRPHCYWQDVSGGGGVGGGGLYMRPHCYWQDVSGGGGVGGGGTIHTELSQEMCCIEETKISQEWGGKGVCVGVGGGDGGWLCCQSSIIDTCVYSPFVSVEV